MDQKKLSNPSSTGGEGHHFEAHIQASFVVLMLTGGYAPCLPCWPITEISLQGKIDGFNTDDLIVYVEKNDGKEKRKLLGQVKLSISITKKNKIFSDVICAAWKDFNNPKLFSKGKDIIALITGPLNATDSNVDWLLGHARDTKDVNEFYRNVSRANFSSDLKREKLKVIEHHLKFANDNTEVSRENIYSFLRHFHMLGYDLGNEFGVILSLLHSHISQFNRQYPQWLWSRVVDIVQTRNQNAGTITLKNIPEDVREAFKQKAVIHIPKEFVETQIEKTKTDWNQHQYAVDLALANMIGSWSEKNEADIQIVSSFTDQNYQTFIQRVREVLHFPNSPLSFRNGVWKIAERDALWDALGSRIFDENLDKFKKIAVTVLTERDPSFELPGEERYAASIHGKVFTHSQALRKGLADGLAVLGNNSKRLVNCSQGKAEATAVLAIREIFVNADWVLWGSIDKLLPVLAEAAPDEFLKIVENALLASPCPFDELFLQESSGVVTGNNYLSGLLWALEGLAWDEEYLVHVCIVLGKLASHDPGGTWSNRPENSLSTILLPWLPQTIASIEKRKIAVKTLQREHPDIAWKLVVSLLPNQHQVSAGSHKPTWRKTILESWQERPTQHEYWEQVEFYAELAVSIADHDTSKLGELIGNFYNLPKPSFDKLLEVLSSDSVLKISEKERLYLWEKLTKFTSRHRRFSDTKRALSNDLLCKLEEVTRKLAPLSPSSLYRRLFSQNDHDLFEEKGSWDEQRKNLEKRREKAIEEILSFGGIKSVTQFAESVASPGQVGRSLGSIAGIETDTFLLPAYLKTKSHNLSFFISDYIWSRHLANGWSWADALDRSSWDKEQIGQFLSCLPFTKEAWNRASEWLGDSQKYYWLKTNAYPYQTENNLEVAIEKLIEYKRPLEAIRCLDEMRHDHQPINATQCVKALLSALSFPKLSNSMDTHHITELIKMLQENSQVSQDDLFQVEWAYLPLLDRHHGATPKFLENRLASNPEFFCEIIQLIYRSNKTGSTVVETSENRKAIAENAWLLLYTWQTPPGTQNDGNFNEAEFSSWLRRVKEICEESGHLEVALVTIGDALVHCPPDNDGLWINRAVAAALNAEDMEDMRNGFSTGLFNSRGVHWVDPTGKPELELAEQYQQKAEDVENAGYHRLATTLRDVSKSYVREAENILSGTTSVDGDYK